MLSPFYTGPVKILRHTRDKEVASLSGRLWLPGNMWEEQEEEPESISGARHGGLCFPS